MRDEALAKIKTARLRRLEVLEEQIAIVGESNADPAQLIERDKLRETLGIVEAADPTIDDETRRVLRRYDQADLNINVLANVVKRLTALEEWWSTDNVKRGQRQTVLNLWLGAITILLLAQILSRWM